MSEPITTADEPLATLLGAIAAKRPTPGGGAVAAAAGALAAAIGEMVLAYSLGRKSTVEHDEELTEIADKMMGLRRQLLRLFESDQTAFARLGEAKAALKASTDATRDSAESAVAAAVMGCVEEPRAVAAVGVELLRLARRAAPVANPYLLSDLAVCCELAMATVRAALCSVRVNLPDLPEADRSRERARAAAMLADATALVREVVPAIEGRMNPT